MMEKYPTIDDGKISTQNIGYYGELCLCKTNTKEQ